MKINQFPVPFATIVSDAPEITFESGDLLVVRPIFSQPTAQIRDFWTRLSKLNGDSDSAEADALILELIERTVVKWSLEGPEGPIPKPTTVDELNALPGALRGALFPFLSNYRGPGPDPTPAA